MKIGISGAQSVGKTTLVNALHEEDTFRFIPLCTGLTRRVQSYGLKINEGGTDTTQRLIMQEHIVNMFMHNSFIADRTALDGVVYSRYLYNKGQIGLHTYDFAVDVFKKVQPYYNFQFYIKPEFDIENDGVRSVDIEFRDEIDSIFRYFITQYNLNVFSLFGTVEERIMQIKTILKGYYICKMN